MLQDVRMPPLGEDAVVGGRRDVNPVQAGGAHREPVARRGDIDASARTVRHGEGRIAPGGADADSRRRRHLAVAVRPRGGSRRALRPRRALWTFSAAGDGEGQGELAPRART